MSTKKSEKQTGHGQHTAKVAGSGKKNEKSAGNLNKNEKSIETAKKNEKPQRKPFYLSKKRTPADATQLAATSARHISPDYLDIINVINRQGGQLAVNAFLRQAGIGFPFPPPPLQQQQQQQQPGGPAACVPTAPHKNVDICAIKAPKMSASHSGAAGVVNAKITSFVKKPDSGAAATDAKLRPIDDVIRRISSPRQRVLVLLRGCPGSGKSTLAKKLKHSGVILSADNFFVRNGKYEYDPQRLTEAHATVRFQTLEYMQSGVSPIVIDNTNLETWEMEPYMLQAVKLHYFVALLEPETPWRYDARVLAKLNSHGVPHAKIVEMLERFDHKVNVHVLRKLIQPKIDTYKLEKLKFQMRGQMMGADGDPSVGPILPLMSMATIGANKASAGGGKAGAVLEPTPAESLLLLEDDIPDKSKAKADANELLTSSMKDLMDINFLVAQSSEGDAQTSSGTKVPSCSSNAEKVSSLASLLLAAKNATTGVSKDTELKASGDKKEQPRSRGPPALKTNKEIGLDAIRYEDAVRSLQNHFSLVTPEALYDLVAQCDGDVHYAANLLLDSGYQWKNADNSDPANAAENESVAGGNTDKDDSEEESVSNAYSDNETNACSDDVDQDFESGAIPDADDGSQLMLRIDPLFAVQLEKLFGPVGFHVAPESYYGNDLSVAIDEDTARVIHSAWALSLAQKFAREEETLKEMLSDENYAEQLQQEEDAHIAAKLDAEERDPNFPALTTEALLLDAKSKATSKMDGLASKIKLQQLYDMFPKIDRKAVENVFNAHGGNLIDTIQAVEDSFRPHDKPSLVIAPEMIKEYDDAWLKIGQRESMLLHEKEMEGEALSAMVDPTYDDLRAEATVHYHKRQECFQRAQEAHRSNMAAVASFYSQQGHLHSQKLHEANKRAKQIILAKLNDGRKENTLDLHMLHVHEAMEALGTFLDQKKRELKASGDALLAVNLITGKGTHSENGLPRIRPAVIDHLRRHDYRTYEVNGGVIEVNLLRADLD